MPDHAAAGLLPVVELELRCQDGPGEGSTLFVHRMTLVEEVSRPFVLSLEIATEDAELDLPGLVGSSIELAMRRGDHSRSVFGVVTAADSLGGAHDRLLADLRVEPAFAAMRGNVTSRIFQGQSPLEVLEAVLEPLGDYARTWNLGAKMRATEPREYCVQYRESDFDFVSRILEEEGISYVFVHDEAKGHEVLTLVYETADCEPVVNVDGSSVMPIEVSRGEPTEVESISAVWWHNEMVPSGAARQDYDFEDPLHPLREAVGGPDAWGRTRRRYAHQQRRYAVDDVAARLQDEHEAASLRRDMIYGESRATILEPGRCFELDRHHHPELERAYVVTRVVHEVYCPEALHNSTEALEDAPPRYTNRFESLPTTTPLRPAQETAKPRIMGPQTAIVTGPPSEEIHTDAYGRVRVQFNWDERAVYDDTSCCWLRTAQTLAGPGWGTQFIPRVGMEVLVTFLEGNPDRPLVVGCLYNGDNAPPFELPDNRSQSGIRTRSTPDGTGSNELRFEDAIGAEEIYLHGEKDWNSVVEHDRSATIRNDDVLTVERHRTEEVGDKREIHVGGTHTETIDATMSLTVNADRVVTVKDDVIETFESQHTQTVKKKKRINVEDAYEESVKLERSLDAGGALSLSSGAEGTVACEKSLSLSAGKAIEIAAGGELGIATDKAMEQSSKKAFTVDCGDKLTFKAKKEVVIQCGDAKITMSKSGEIVIKGSDIKVKGSGDVVLKGSSVASN